MGHIICDIIKIMCVLNFTFGNSISPFYCLSFWYHSFVQRTSPYDNIEIDFQVVLRSVSPFSSVT